MLRIYRCSLFPQPEEVNLGLLIDASALPPTIAG
jgi:hypothetical protein